MSSLRFALRSLRKSPGYTIIALVTLALGIGVNTSMFSLVNELLFRAAPYPQGAEIHQILGETRTGRRWSFSETEIREIRANSRSFQSLGVLDYGGSALTEPGRPAEQVQSVMVSPEFFDVFRVQPFRGRAFAAEEHGPGHNHVIILSYPF